VDKKTWGIGLKKKSNGTKRRLKYMEGLLAILSIFVILPGMILTFAYRNKKNKNELKKLEYEREIMQLEIEKDNLRIKLLEEENKKLDKIINEN
jgi:hypothetical protein